MGDDSQLFTNKPGIFYDGNGKAIGTGIMFDEVDTIPTDIDSEAFTLAKINDAEFSMGISIDVGLLKKLVDDDLRNNNNDDPLGYTIRYKTTRSEQVRRHKKKRINKKWAKRYGYREVPYTYIFKNAYVESRPFNDFSFTSSDISIEKGE